MRYNEYEERKYTGKTMIIVPEDDPFQLGPPRKIHKPPFFFPLFLFPPASFLLVFPPISLFVAAVAILLGKPSPPFCCSSPQQHGLLTTFMAARPIWSGFMVREGGSPSHFKRNALKKIIIIKRKTKLHSLRVFTLTRVYSYVEVLRGSVLF